MSNIPLERTPLQRIIAEYVETWDGVNGYAGFCVCQVIEEEGKPVRVHRGKALYLRDLPDMRDWFEIYNRSASNLKARAYYETKHKKRKAA